MNEETQTVEVEVNWFNIDWAVHVTGKSYVYLVSLLIAAEADKVVVHHQGVKGLAQKSVAFSTARKIVEDHQKRIRTYHA